MSVLRIIWLNCDGCEAGRFAPEVPSVYSVQVRQLAEAAGWLVNYRNTSKDYCRACAVRPDLVNPRRTRGICQGCDTEQVVTLQGKVKLHRRRVGGARPACPGGGHAPRSVTRSAAPRGNAWQSLI